MPLPVQRTQTSHSWNDENRQTRVQAAGGVDLQAPWLLVLVTTGLSNLVSNVPAVMLLTRFLDAADPRQWYLLALASTFAGNLIVIGSIANLIVIEQARTWGVPVSFRAHARMGIPVTLASLGVVLAWAALAA